MSLVTDDKNGHGSQLDNGKGGGGGEYTESRVFLHFSLILSRQGFLQSKYTIYCHKFAEIFGNFEKVPLKLVCRLRLTRPFFFKNQPDGPSKCSACMQLSL